MKKWFENLAIAGKLRTGFLFITLLGVGIGVVGIFHMLGMSKDSQDAYDHYTLGIKYAYKAESDFMALGKAMSGLQINLNDPAAKNEYIAKVEAYMAAIDEDFNLYSGTISDDHGQEMFQTIKADYAMYLDVINKNLKIAKQGGTAGDMMANMSGAASIAQDAAEAFEALVAYDDTKAREGVIRSNESASAAMYIMIAVIVVSFGVGILMSRYISAMISKPMEKFAAFAELVAVGDMDISKVTEEKDRLWALRKDEVGKLAGAFDKMAASTAEQAEKTAAIAEGDLTAEITVRSEHDVMGKALSELVEKFHALAMTIVSSADQVNAGARQIADSSTSLSQSATEQASSVEELSASMEEMTAQTAENAQNAQKTYELAEAIKTDAEAGTTRMKDMLQAMDEINVSSDSIGKVIKVIEDLAFQTNILALNAAVEAARAGQHGKGFAVVAEEVRSLAGKSAQAAQETTALIGTSVQKVKVGTAIANETAGALNKIAEGIVQAAGLVGAIATASHGQAAALEQVNQGIMEISQVVQSNAAAAEEGAAASEELSAQAGLLKGSVSIFKLNNSSPKNERSDFKEEKPFFQGERSPRRPAPSQVLSLAGGGAGKY